MKRMYDWVLSLAQTRYSQVALFLIALIESFIFPIPPDVLLMPMCLGAPQKALRFAAICTVGSLLGAGLGYAIGHYLWWNGTEFSGLAMWFFSHVPGFSQAQFSRVKELYDEYSFWVVFTAAFTPIPFKVITITAGAFSVTPAMFLIASAVGRAGRFFLVAGLLWVWGEKVKALIEKYFNLLTILLMVLLVGGFVAAKFLLSH